MRHEDHKGDFRFFADDIIEVAEALLPEKITGPDRHCANRVVALCVVLRTLAYPEKQNRTAALFGHGTAWVSSILHATLHILAQKATRAFNGFSPDLAQKIPSMVQAVFERFGLHAWAFADGTKVMIPRPSIQQRRFYNGYEGTHVLRSLVLVRADGLIELAFGPYPGANGDSGLYSFENVEAMLQHLHDQVLLANPMMSRPYILSDGAFQTTINNVTPYSFDPTNMRMRDRIFNVLHSSARIGAEWGFGRMKITWRSLNLEETMRLLW